MKMIKINLLPIEFRTVKKRRAATSVAKGEGVGAIGGRWPWKKVIVGLIVALVLVTAYYNFGYWQVTQKWKAANTDSVAVQPELQALRALEQEVSGVLVPERDFLRTHVLNKAPLTHILQLISESLPDGMWLEALKIQNSGKQRSFRIQGLAVNIESKTNIEQIEEYLEGLKQVIPSAQFVYSTAKQVVDQVSATAFVAEYQWQAD